MRRFTSLLLSLLIIPLPLTVVLAKPLLSERINEEIEEFFSWLKGVLSLIREQAVMLGKALGATILVIGLVMWGSDLFAYKGRRLITTGALLLLILELIS